MSTFIYPKMMKGWVDLNGWPTADVVYPHKWSPISWRSSTGQESSPVKDQCSTSAPRNQLWPWCFEPFLNSNNKQWSVLWPRWL